MKHLNSKKPDPGKVIIGGYTVPVSGKSGKALVGYFTTATKSGSVIIGMIISGINPNIIIG